MNRVKEALEALKRNEIILVTDDEDRENEGDMICAGENVTGEMINIILLWHTWTALSSKSRTLH